MDIYERPDHLFDEEPKMYEHLDWTGNEVFFGEMMPGDDEEATDDVTADVDDSDDDMDDHDHEDGEEHDHDHDHDDDESDDDEEM
jgi:hypothetical protein